jgi:SpoVK/Ycf46/Vps4 family AAA+-type ATPase
MSESSQEKVRIPDHDKGSFKRMLEFIYTNNVRDLESSRSPQDIMTLLTMSSEFVLEDLRELCEQAAAHVLSLENIGKFMVLSQRDPNATYLRDMCRKFYVQNRSVLRKDPSFRQEIENSPELGLLILDANIDEDEGYVPASKRRRVTDLSGEHELVPGQSGGANTIGSGNLSGAEQW